MSDDSLPIQTLEVRLLRRTFFTSLVVGLAGIGLSVVAAILFDGLGDRIRTMRLTMCPLLLLFFGAVGLASTARIHEREYVAVSRITIGLLVTTCVLWFFFLLLPFKRFGPGPAQIFIARLGGTSGACVLVLTLATQMMQTKTRTTLIRIPAIVIASLLGFFSLVVVVLVWTSFWFPFEEVVLPIVTLGGLALLVMAAAYPSFVQLIEKRRTPAELAALPHRIHLRLNCPVCERSQSLPTGPGRCAGCRAPILIEVEEPRCGCGYLLFRLTGETCPECGRPVTQPPRPP